MVMGHSSGFLTGNKKGALWGALVFFIEGQ